MIVFHDLLKRLSEEGWTLKRLQNEGGISNGTIIRIRKGESISTVTIDKVCKILNCQPGDLITYQPDEMNEGN